MDGMMSHVGWSVLLVGLALAADVAWAEFRTWRRRRDARKHARTLTAKFGLKRF